MKAKHVLQKFEATPGLMWNEVFSIKITNHEPDPMKLIHVIRKGVPGNSIARFAEFCQVPRKDLYRLLKISPRTAERAAAKNLDIRVSDRLIQMAKVYQRCLEVFVSSEKAMRWLQSPNYALGNEKPWDLLDTTEGIELVQDTLTRIEHGVFA